MVEHCDNCGTELDADQPRHQRYRFEAVSDDSETLRGALCSDCYFEFTEWLDTRDVADAADAN